MAVACPAVFNPTIPDPSDFTNATPWFALQVRTRWEQLTAGLLCGKGYETFLPTYKVHRRWSGSFREVETPLFPGYVFCSFDVYKRLPILVTPGVIAVVSRGRIPVPVNACELDAIRSAVRSGRAAEPWPYLKIGQRVRVHDEVLQGIEGILIRFKGSDRVVLSVSLLQRSVALEIDRCRLTLIH